MIAPALHLAAEQATTVTRVATPGARVSSAIWVGDTLYLSGTMATPDETVQGVPKFHSNTTQQSISSIQNIQKVLRSQGLDLGDIVQMQVFVASDGTHPPDFAGVNEAYAKFFGTKDQPNLPVRAMVEVKSLVWSGGLVEIIVVAARHR